VLVETRGDDPVERGDREEGEDGSGEDGSGEDGSGELGSPGDRTGGDGSGEVGSGEDRTGGDQPPGDGPLEHEPPEGSDPLRFNTWMKRSATGAVLTGISLGLREALELKKNEPAIMIEASGEPEDPDNPIRLHFDPDDPRATVAVIRMPPEHGAPGAPPAGATDPDTPDTPDPTE